MADVTRSIEYVVSAVDKASATFKKISVGSLALGAGITGALALMVKGAAEAQVSMAKIDATLGTMGAAGKNAKAGILEAANAAVKLGFDDEAAAESITNLFQRTGDLTQATKLNAIAMDLSRKTGMDLGAASKSVGMVLSGNGKILKQYGIDLNEAGTPAQALDELQKKLAGSAAAYADTLPGKLDRLKESWSNVSDAIGEKLIPVLTQVLDAMMPVIDAVQKWMNDNPTLTATLVKIVAAAGILLTVLGSLGLIIGPITTAIGFLSAAGTALGVVLTFLAANPIVLIIAAIVAIGFAIYELIKHWDEVKVVAQKVILAIVEYAQKWADDFLGIMKAVGAFILGIFMDPINTIRSAYESFFSWLADKFAWLAGATTAAEQKANQGPKYPSSNLTSAQVSAAKKRALGGTVGMFEPFTWVGENGPEMVSLPAGSKVSPSGSSRGGGIQLNITVQGSVIGLSPNELVQRLGSEIMRQINPTIAHA